ncbi:hypothetical protein AB0M46_09540 [Dactylosporangium sp. NPDC051485]|uniref:hypothetical protein n=1 Tax=Dactylosporangium sp. NPDC051485 TaxID=3154846 RepID=UPI00343816F8
MTSPQLGRPGVVSASTWALVGGAALIAAGMAMETNEYFVSVKVYEDSVADGTVASGSVEGLVSLFALAEAALVFGMAGALATLAVRTGRGLPGVRTAASVVAVLAMLCPSASLSGRVRDSVGAAGVVQRGVEASLPQWYIPVHIGIEAAALLCLIAGLALLATPAARRYFKAAPVRTA